MHEDHRIVTYKDENSDFSEPKKNTAKNLSAEISLLDYGCCKKWN